MANVPARFWSVAGVSVGRNGVSEMKTQKSFSREPQQSVRFQTTTELTAAEAPKSTCHQALVSALVAVTEPSGKLPSVLPSTADAALALAFPGNVLLWLASLPCATFVGAVPPIPNTWTSARLRLFVPLSCTRTYRPCAGPAIVVEGLGAAV